MITAGIGPEGANKDVGEAVAVDIARRGGRGAAAVKGIDAVEAEAVRAVERREVEARREAGGPSEHDVARARFVVPAGIGTESTDDEIGEAVAIDVSCRRDRSATRVTCIDAVEAEAGVGSGAAGERRKIDN